MIANNDFTQLFEMHQGIFYTQLLHQGINLSVFDHLKQKTDTATLSEKLGTHPQNTLFFLRGLAAAGLVNTDGSGRFWNTPLSQTYLVKGSPSFLGDYLTNHARWNMPFFKDMESIIKNGPPARENRADDEEIWANEARGLVNFQHTCTGPVLARILSELPQFSRFTRMLDLGGGPGLNAMAVVQAHPTMTGTVFDRPAVVRVAKQEIQKKGLENRVTVQGGDFTRDAIGRDHDLIMATACLNFVRDDLDEMAAKILDALSPGGIFVSVHDGMTRGRTRPQSIAMSWMPVSMMWQELSLDRGQIARACLGAGFKTVRSQPVKYGLGTMELEIAQKTGPA